MPYYSQPERIPTLIEALNQQTVDQLKALARLLPEDMCRRAKQNW